MNKKIVLEVISQINSMFDRKLDFSEEIIKENILGNQICLNAEDLTYLFFALEKKYNIKIDQETVVEGLFNTIENIAQVIEEALAVRA